MTELPTIHEALAAVKDAVGAVKKGERNQAQNFNFRGIDAVVNASAPALNKFGVITVPTVLEHTYGTVEVGAKRTPMAHVVLKVKYSFVGPRGDSVDSTVMSESMDSGDKAMAKAMSVAYRIALLQTLNLPTDDVDPDHDVYERSGSETASKTPSRPAASRAKAETPKAAETASEPKKATSGDLAKLVKAAESAKTADQLNAAWKAAGEIGALQEAVAFPGTSESGTFQQYLYHRADAIKSAKSD